MSLHAQIANDIKLDEQFHALFEKCCRTPPPQATPVTPLTPDKIRARVRERAASRQEEATDPTIRRPTRPRKPVTPPARQARASTARSNEPTPIRRAVLIQAPPATAAISRSQRTAGTPRTTRRKTQPNQISHTDRPTIGQTRPPPDPSTTSSHPAATVHPVTPTTKVMVPGGETLEVSTRIIRDVRRYRARTHNGHWILRWDQAGKLTLARFAERNTDR